MAHTTVELLRRVRFGRSHLPRLLAAGAFTLFCSACGDLGPSKNSNTDFSDRLEVGGFDIFQFNVSKNGEFSVTLTALSNPNAVLGVWVGQPGNGVCNPIAGYVTPIAVLNRDALNSFIQKGTYCLEVYDPGSLTEAVNYTVRVSHP